MRATMAGGRAKRARDKGLSSGVVIGLVGIGLTLLIGVVGILVSIFSTGARQWLDNRACPAILGVINQAWGLFVALGDPRLQVAAVFVIVSGCLGVALYLAMSSDYLQTSVQLLLS